MWEAVATVACLACVCVAEVVEGWRRRGTSGTQLVCHSLSLLPATITTDRPGPGPETNGLSSAEVEAGRNAFLQNVPTHQSQCLLASSISVACLCNCDPARLST